MKTKITIAILLILFFSQVFGQVVIDKGIYKVNFSNILHVPRYVSYYLFNGGGDCDRKKMGFSFKNDMNELDCAKNADYANNPNHYEKGHMANAEDFASDCKKEELTFRYYNCLPQLKELNGQLWNYNEAKIREWSKKEKLYIICGGFFKNLKMGRIAVPSYCWKVVQSVTTKKVLFCGWFNNFYPVKLDTISVSELEHRLNSKLILLR